MADGVGTGVAYRPRHRVLQPLWWSVALLLAEGRGTEMSATS